MSPADEIELGQYRKDYPVLLASCRRLREELDEADRYGLIATVVALIFFALILLQIFNVLP